MNLIISKTGKQTSQLFYFQQNKERVRQSAQELLHLAKYRHENILMLLAYSMDGSEPCLIYRE